MKSIDQIVNFCLDLLEWLEMLPINPLFLKKFAFLFVSILTNKNVFKKLLGGLKPRQPVNPGLPEKKQNWLATRLHFFAF